MNEYAINEYEWVPFDEGEDMLPFCIDCKLFRKGDHPYQNKPCVGCEAVRAADDYPKGRLYFKPKDGSQ